MVEIHAARVGLPEARLIAAMRGDERREVSGGAAAVQGDLHPVGVDRRHKQETSPLHRTPQRDTVQ